LRSRRPDRNRHEKVNSHAVLQEFLCFLRGETNVKPLEGDDFREDDFKLIDYKSHKGIKAPIAV
jgi:thymidylate synthase